MSINIAQLAGRAINKAWALAAGELTPCTVRDLPTFTHDTATGADVVSAWGVEVTTGGDGEPMRAFMWMKEASEDGQAPKDWAGSMRSGIQKAIVRRSDLPGVAELTTAAELVVGSNVWKVSRTQSPPGGAIFILDLQK